MHTKVGMEIFLILLSYYFLDSYCLLEVIEPGHKSLLKIVMLDK